MKVLISLLIPLLGVYSSFSQSSTEYVVPEFNQSIKTEANALAALDLSGEIILSSMELKEINLADVSRVYGGISESTGNGFSMDQNSPNPCNEMTGIRYFMPSPGDVEFRIFNLIGKEVYRSLITAEQGDNEFRLDSREFTQGVYMYTMTYNGETLSKRMVISRK